MKVRLYRWLHRCRPVYDVACVLAAIIFCAVLLMCCVKACEPFVVLAVSN